MLEKKQLSVPRSPVEESRFYKWEELTEEQQRAAARVGELLEGIARSPAGREPSSPDLLDHILPHIRKEHWNNVILIDGDRGSGKTSLMASILHVLGTNLRKWSKEVETFLGFAPFPEQIIPVAFLDLHPLPASTHLLFHLVGRLERVVRALEAASPTRGDSGAPAWHNSATTPLQSRERWEALSEVVATAWDGNLAQRAPNLDTEFYAWELAKLERNRLGVAETFRNFVDALHSEFSALRFHRRTEGIEDPLFLITVDDVDMVPHRSKEVLDLLRMLWHSRVVFLLTGHSDQLLTLLRNEYLGVLLRPLSNLHIAEDKGIKEEAASRALFLARSTLDKIIPPPHRCKVSNLPDSEKRNIVRKELAALTINYPAPEDKDRLLFYFDRDEYAAKALPNQIRPLLNLQRELSSLAAVEAQPHHREIAYAITEIWRDVLQREPLLTGEERDALSGVVRLDENRMLVVDGGVVDCSFAGRRVSEITADGKSVALMRSQALVVRLHGKRVLPDSLNGALKLATNLVADIDAFHFFGESPAPSGFDLAPVVVRWEDPAIGLRAGSTWPLPDWQGFLSTTLFVKAWNEALLSNHPSEDPKVSYLAKLFMKFVIDLAEKRSTAPPDQVPSWEDLAGSLAELLTKTVNTERDRRIRSWVLGRTGLLAAPESGLPAVEANSWLASLKMKLTARVADWGASRVLLLEQRRVQIRDRWEGGEPSRDEVSEILKTIDARSREFDWVKEISRAPSRRPIPRAAQSQTISSSQKI